MSTYTDTSFFESVDLLPEDSILSIPIAFKADTRPNKVNLGVGSYKDALGKPYTLISVRDAEALLHAQNLDKEYAPIAGNKQFIDESLKLIFGDAHQIKNGQICAFQTLGATGAIRMGLEFLLEHHNPTVYISTPTWPNHFSIVKYAGMKSEFYPYYDALNHQIDFEGMCNAIKKMKPGSVIILHAGCHNPTGADPSTNQWKQLSDLIKAQKIIPFFDFAYQGFGVDVEKDAEPIRMFLNDGHELFAAHSCSKNFGLYGERIGSLSIATQQPVHARKVESHIKQLIRSSYSNPPLHGGRTIALILSNDQLKKEWLHELKNMRDRIVEMRECLFFGLQSKTEHRDFSFIKKQNGFFSLLGISAEKVKELRDAFSIYMPPDGRINIAGLNTSNIDYVVDSIGKVLSS